MGSFVHSQQVGGVDARHEKNGNGAIGGFSGKTRPPGQFPLGFGTLN